MDIDKGSSITADIDVDNAEIDVGWNLQQTQFWLVNARVVVRVRPTNQRRRNQSTAEIVGPAVIRAAHALLGFTRFADQNHSAMTADVFVDAYLIFTVSDDNQWHTGLFNRIDIANLWHVALKCDAGPLAQEQTLGLLRIYCGVRIKLVGQPIGRFNGLLNFGEVRHQTSTMIEISEP